MSYSIDILCSGDKSLTRREIAEFITDGVYFDTVAFRPTLESSDSEASGWDRLEIGYNNARVPIIVRRHVGSQAREFREIVETTFVEHDLECPPDIRSHLTSIMQVFELEFDRGGSISEDCWAMLARLESHLARTCNGLVFSHEDGVFDADLQLIAGL